MSKKSNLKYSIKELQKALSIFGDSYKTEVEFFLEFLETNPLKKRSLIPSGGNDCIMTPPELAEQIVGHFSRLVNETHLNFLEPCRGEGAFYNAMLRVVSSKAHKDAEFDWCELSEGKDFLDLKFNLFKYDFIFTNPPFSKLRAFLKKSMELADNIVFLCPVNHILGLKARKRDVKEAGFFVREVCRVEKPIEWPSSGFEYAAIYLSRQAGDCKFSEL